MNKNIIILNGKGASGKDTLVSMLGNKYSCLHDSSINPIKECAKIVGWNGTKTDKDRKFLADLKKLVTEYNDYTNTYLTKVCFSFLRDDENSFLFIDIREPVYIESFFKYIVPIIGRLCPKENTMNVKTLLIRSKRTQDHTYGTVDDDVDNYEYDMIYDNDIFITTEEDKEKVATNFIKFIESNCNIK